MQKKHLHGFLLILLLVGCGGRKFSADNAFLAGKKGMELSFESESPAPALLWGPVELRATSPSQYSEPFAFQIFPYSTRAWIGGLQVDGFDRKAARVERSLTTLMIEDTAAGLRTMAMPLPHGAGVAFYLEGESYSTVAFHLSQTSKDTVFLRQSETGSVEQYRLGDAFVAIAASPAFEEHTADENPAIVRPLKEGKRRQVIVAVDRTAAGARAVAEAYRGMKRTKLEAAVLDSLSSKLAFSLQTEDANVNRAFALLAAALAEIAPRVDLQYRLSPADYARLAPALFLASRARPNLVFAPAGAKEASQRVRWGLEAYRAAVQYGMADPDSLKAAALRVLAEAARLHEEYSSNLFALGDETIPDTLLRLAVAHVQYAELQALCGDITLARGDREAELSYRTDALRAAKNARRYFEEAGRLYRAAQLGTKPEPDKYALAPVDSDSTEDQEDLVIGGVNFALPPDTLRYVQAGADYGFAWISEHPAQLIPPELDGYSWQKWVAYHFATDFKVTQTPDLDSTVKLLLDGPLPGTLTESPGHAGEPSLASMSAAFENLSGLYLGYRPQWLQHRVDLEPRPPQSWEHTVARVPFGPGFIHLDYDFANEVAFVGMSGLDSRVDVFFGFPLPTGGFTRTQFVLSPEEPRVRVKLNRDSENRIKLEVKEVKD